MGWQVIIAPSAQSGLADIVRYIAHHNSDAAARLGFELITRAESLANFPEIGRMVPDSGSRTFAKSSAAPIALFTWYSVRTNGFKSSAPGTERADFPISPARSDLCSAFGLDPAAICANLIQTKHAGCLCRLPVPGWLGWAWDRRVYNEIRLE